MFCIPECSVLYLKVLINIKKSLGYHFFLLLLHLIIYDRAFACVEVKEVKEVREVKAICFVTKNST
ncbi:unknown [Prevotella sp. CAG:1092]|nr:unknown [Prevotella sp. CAG:1092]